MNANVERLSLGNAPVSRRAAAASTSFATCSVAARHISAALALVPDDPGQSTSDHGWDTVAQADFLRSVISRLKSANMRVSVFIDADPAAARGAASVKLNPVTRTGRGTTMHERGETLDFDEQMELARYIDKDLGPRAPTPIILNIPPALSSLRKLRHSSASCGDCGVRGILGILGTNQYALCGIGSTCPEFVYGQLGKDSIRDIWLTNPTVLLLRRALADVDSFPGICARCIFARACRTGCVADNYVRSGQLIATEWMCAEAVRREVFPAAKAQRRSQTERAKGGIDRVAE